MDKTRFDSSLSACVDVLKVFFKSDVITQSALIRDINGQLSVILASQLSDDDKEQVVAALQNKLGSYARPYALIADKNDFDAGALLVEAGNCPAFFISGVNVHLIDRRAIGIDWLSAPAKHLPGSIPRVVFSSIKGGVGRSTALCVAAAYLSRRGRRVLAIDFDLEAPGIGSMLLVEDELPLFGSLDFLVESQVGGFDESMLPNMIGGSYLGGAGGRVDVIPAIGKTTLDNPQNALAKIARAYLETQPSDEEAPITLGGKLQKLVELCEATDSYDVILVDSRAGLHESTAATLLSLGGDVLLFGTNQPQTFQGYKLLFAHLARFSIDPKDDWRERLTFVHSKAERADKAQQEVAGKFRETFQWVVISDVSADESEEERLTAEDVEFVWDDSRGEMQSEQAECNVLHVLDDGQYRDFDPIAQRDLLEFDSYEHTFADLINYLDEQVLAVSSEDNQ